MLICEGWQKDFDDIYHIKLIFKFKFLFLRCLNQTCFDLKADLYFLFQLWKYTSCKLLRNCHCSLTTNDSWIAILLDIGKGIFYTKTQEVVWEREKLQGEFSKRRNHHIKDVELFQIVGFPTVSFWLGYLKWLIELE